MKKFWVLLMCVVMCLGLIACNSEPDDTDRDDDASAAATQTMEAVSTATVSATVSTPTPEATSASGVTLEQFITLIQPQVDAMADSVEANGMTLEIIARDNSLVYSYQYIVDLGDLSVVGEALDAAMEQELFSSTFDGVLEQLKSVVPDAESVIVEYLSQDGQLIASKEFK